MRGSSGSRERSKSCLVLDLDETLVHFFGSEDNWDYVQNYEIKEVRNRILDIKVEGEFMWGIARPFVREFLTKAQGLFDCVGIWSAGVESYVGEIAKELFPQKKPYFVWARNKCVVTTLENESVRQKPLSKLFAAFPEIDPKRTIIMDDRSEVCLQDTLSHIDMPIWDATLSDLGREDTTLKCIGEWMEEVIPFSTNYRTSMQKGMFCPKSNFCSKNGFCSKDSSRNVNNTLKQTKIQSTVKKQSYLNSEFW